MNVILCWAIARLNHCHTDFGAMAHLIALKLRYDPDELIVRAESLRTLAHKLRKIADDEMRKPL